MPLRGGPECWPDLGIHGWLRRSLYFIFSRIISCTSRSRTRLSRLASRYPVLTVGVIGVWLRLRDWHRSSAVVTAVAVVVFAYGHVENLLGGHIDERAFFAGAVVLAAVLSILASDTRISRATIFLNVTSSILLFFSVVSLASGATVTAARSTTDDPMMLDRLTDHLPPLNLDQEYSYKPDIYHIVLDALFPK